MNQIFGRNLTIAEDLGANSGTNVVKEVLVGGEEKKG